VANPSTLYRFRLALSDVDRSLYESVDIRVAMHPSESEDYLLTRVLAYALNYEPGLEFLPGLCAGDEPAISLVGENGRISKWIDIGNPSVRRIHKASKAAETVLIYTYKDPQNLKREAQGESVHRASEIRIFSFESDFLKSLAGLLVRDNQWGVIHNEGELVITAGDETVMGSLREDSLV
jgi:uncharacterized protein YaeQ